MKNKAKKIKIVFFAIIFGFFGLTNTSQAAVVFETNFDSVPTWNPQATLDACWQNTKIEGESNSCTQTPWTNPWADGNTIWNDYRFLGSRCSSTSAPHIGSASDIESVKSGANFTPYGGSGKSYVHFYEPCYSGSGGWGSDGLLGVYLGRTNGHSELYVQMKVKFQPNYQWSNGGELKLAHIAHFDENSVSGILQAYNWFDYNLPDFIPQIYHNVNYNPYPQFEFPSRNANKVSSGGVYPVAGVNLFDGNWHTLKFRVKLNSAAGSNDGIKAIWADGVLSHSYTDVNFTGNNTPSAASYGFNRIVIGGNSSNYWMDSGNGNPSCVSNKSCPTQWYAADNLVVSTTDIPDNYIPGGGTTDMAAPAAPSSLSVN